MTIKNQWLKKPHVNSDEIKVLYEKGLSSTQIGKQLGLAKSSVSRRLKKLGVPLKKSKDYFGENRYWLWKGEDYIDPIVRKYNQRRLRKWSAEVRERDGHKCTNCGSQSKRLHSHHLIPIEQCINSEIEFDIENGITLCPKCHKAIHKETMY